MDRRKLITGAVLLVVVLAAFLALRGRRSEPVEETEHADPNAVELSVEAQRTVDLAVGEVEERRIEQRLKATGVVSPDETRVAHILPLAQGVVERVFVQLGDRVDKGQPLLVYDNIELGELIGEHLSLRGSVEKERAQVNVARRSLERAQSLIEVEAISQREYDLRQAEYEQAEAGLQSRRAELARVEEKLHRFGLNEEAIRALRDDGEHGEHRTASHNTLRAPFAGVITKYDVSQGELVSREKELFTLVDTSSVWVLADVYEKDISLVPEKGECEVAVPSYPNERFRGALTYVSDVLDPTTRTAKVRCVVANRDGRLKLEMFADVIIPGRERAVALTVPSSAIQDIDGEPVVFVQRDATHFEKRPVKLGERGEDRVVVVAGVGKGEKVVTRGSFQLKSELLREQIGEEEH